MHYLLFYEKVPDHARREPPLRAAHLAHLQAAVARGEVVLGGSLADPADGTAIVLFRAGSPDVVESFAAADPFVMHGVVSRWRVRRWHTVIGESAAIGPTDEFRTQIHGGPLQ